MVVLDPLRSNQIRQQYIGAFVDTHSEYYTDRIEKLTDFSDGLCYTGYLWDCLKDPQISSEADIEQIIKCKKEFYIMWDIHTCDRILIPNYWKYPKTSVLLANEWTNDLIKELPEDIYLFDASLTWSAIYTHETDIYGDRYCMYLEKAWDSSPP